jgi:uncharacterized repeat protein (TIGR01451 family)
MVIVRLGQRQFTPEEMAQQGIPGTVLLPGDKVLRLPACAPWVPWSCVPFYDPLYGPRCPEEECLHDGGDEGRPAGIDRNGQLHGLDPADTVAEYTDSRGRRKLACSNRVCICVPRFLVIRSEMATAGYSSRVVPGDTLNVQMREQIRTRTPSSQAEQFARPAGMQEKKRLSGTTNVQTLGRIDRLEVLNAYQLETGPGGLLDTYGLRMLTEEQKTLLKKQMEFALSLSQPYRLAGIEQVLKGPAVMGRVRGVKLLVTLQETRDLTVICAKAPLPPSPDKPLVLIKWADRQAAQVGDVVTFFLKYTNHGGQPITDVALSDSLTARLEYIPGSAQSDRDAVFTTQENEAGSVILRWEINGKLMPGSSGVVRFQARVR